MQRDFVCLSVTVELTFGDSRVAVQENRVARQEVERKDDHRWLAGGV